MSAPAGTDRGSLIDALQAALQRELRAEYGYALLGPRLTTQESKDQALAYQQEHIQLVSATRAALVGFGATPDSPAPSYPDMYPVTDDAAATALALRLEDDAASGWRDVYRETAADPQSVAPGAGTTEHQSSGAATGGPTPAGTGPAGTAPSGGPATVSGTTPSATSATASEASPDPAPSIARLRSAAQRALIDSALRAVTWRGTPTAFPGA